MPFVFKAMVTNTIFSCYSFLHNRWWPLSNWSQSGPRSINSRVLSEIVVEFFATDVSFTAVTKRIALQASINDFCISKYCKTPQSRNECLYPDTRFDIIGVRNALPVSNGHCFGDQEANSQSNENCCFHFWENFWILIGFPNWWPPMISAFWNQLWLFNLNKNVMPTFDTRPIFIWHLLTHLIALLADD